MSKKFDLIDHDRVLELYKKSYDIPRIIAESGLSEYYVYKILKLHECKTGYKIDRVNKENIYEMYVKCNDVKYVCEYFNISYHILQKILAQYNIKLKKRTFISDLNHASVIKDYRDIRDIKIVAKKYGVSITLINKVLRINNIVRKKKLIKTNIILPQIKKYPYDNEIIEVYNKTLTISKTSEILKCSCNRIRSALERNAILLHKTCRRIKIGDRFNRFTVIDIAVPKRTINGASKKMLICKCDCGSIRTYSSNELRSGRKTSCGCIMKEKMLNRQLKQSNKKIITPEEKIKLIEERNKRKKEKLDEQQKKREALEVKYESTRYHIGDKVNRWTILSNETRPESKSIKSSDIIKLQCECGTIKIRQAMGIKNSISCGCYQKERSTKNGLFGGKDNREKRLMYARYKNMKKRCYNITNHQYINYGMRGITICDRWMEPNGQGFVNFCQDMGPRPGTEYSIDRIDNNGNYEPINCQWATSKQQNQNKRNSIKKKRILLYEVNKKEIPF